MEKATPLQSISACLEPHFTDFMTVTTTSYAFPSCFPSCCGGERSCADFKGL